MKKRVTYDESGNYVGFAPAKENFDFLDGYEGFLPVLRLEKIRRKKEIYMSLQILLQYRDGQMVLYLHKDIVDNVKRKCFREIKKSGLLECFLADEDEKKAFGEALLAACGEDIS